MCQRIGDFDYLTADYRLKCFTPEWNVHAAWAGIMVALVPVGLPLGLTVYLVRNRHRLDSADMKRTLGFVYTSYRKKFFFWYSNHCGLRRRLVVRTLFHYSASSWNICLAGSLLISFASCFCPVLCCFFCSCLCSSSLLCLVPKLAIVALVFLSVLCGVFLIVLLHCVSRLCGVFWQAKRPSVDHGPPHFVSVPPIARLDSTL